MTSSARTGCQSGNSPRPWRYVVGFAWCGCLVWLVAIIYTPSSGSNVLRGPPHLLTSDAGHGAKSLPPVGVRLTSSAEREIGVLAPDSATALLVVSPECPVSAIHRSSYDQLVEEARARGLAFRVLITLFDGEATLFPRIAPQGMPVVYDASGSVLRDLNIYAFPSLIVVDALGTVVHSALPNPETVWTELPPEL